MAKLHKEFINYNTEIKISSQTVNNLHFSRNSIRSKIKSWFASNKKDNIQPVFSSQGSIVMGTAVNPIPEYDSQGNKILKYDIDDGVYFIRKSSVEKRISPSTIHSWVINAVTGQTSIDPINKNTCVRVMYSDGHNIDLPLYDKLEDEVHLAHLSKGYTPSDPKKFADWFSDNSNQQIKRLVRYLKGWKNFRETKNSSLSLPSGFELSILVVNHYVEMDNDDESLLKTLRNMQRMLTQVNGFICLRPTVPEGENLFETYSESRKSSFLNTLDSLVADLQRAGDEVNFKKASEILRSNQFGERFPLGVDLTQESVSNSLKNSILAAPIIPKPYGTK